MQPRAIQGEHMQARGGGELTAMLLKADRCLTKGAASARGRADLLRARCDTLYATALSVSLHHGLYLHVMTGLWAPAPARSLIMQFLRLDKPSTLVA